MSASAELTAVARTLQAAKKVVVACHEAPDGDAIGSLIGCGTALRRGGWDTVLWAPGDTPLPADYAWLGYDDVARMPPADLSERLLLALDCGSAQRLGVDGAAALTTADATINIDHHSDNTQFANINLVDATAPCASILVLRLLRLLELPLTPDVATALYVGIVTDTGRFQFANGTAESHTEAAALIDAGVAVDEVFRNLYEGKPAARILLLGRALSTLQVRQNGRLAVACLTIADLDATGAQESDSEGIIDHLRAIAGIEVAAVIRAPRSGAGLVQKCSLRSAQPSINVADIAHAAGGGGHPLAAGFALAGTADDVIALIEQEMAGD